MTAPQPVYLIRSTVETLFDGSLAWWNTEHGWVPQDFASIHLSDDLLRANLPDTGEWVQFAPVTVPEEVSATT